MKGICKFRFKKEKHGAWDLTTVVNIWYCDHNIGYIQDDQDGKWIVRLRTPASAKAIIANPNCPWMWVRVKTKFDSEKAAKEWLNENRACLIDGVCYIEKEAEA